MNVPLRRAEFEVAHDPAVELAARAGAVFAFSLSGGKDCGGTSAAAMEWLDGLGHPRERRIALHADLGRAEWPSTPSHVQRQADALGLPLTVVRRAAGDLVARFERRFELGRERYRDLLLYNLIGPWSSAAMKFCQSELKIQVMGPYLAREFAGQTIVQVVGIRREESSGRKHAPVAKIDARFAKAGNKAGTKMLVWHPGVDWTREEVLECNRVHGIPLHEAYEVHGSSRLSCAFCVFASIGDQQAAIREVGNHDLYRHLVGMEVGSTFSFQPARWLADLAPSLLSTGLARDIERAKAAATERRTIEAAMPARHRFVKGWPLHLPTIDEAQVIADSRRTILRYHEIEERFPSAIAVRERFAELLAQKASGARSPKA